MSQSHDPARGDVSFAQMLESLACPAAFPDEAQPDARAEVVQTHASAVLLAGDLAYKLKKPRDFGFFDYSTPERRRHFCREEVRLNARLAPSVYLGIAPVLALPGGDLRFGVTRPADSAPEPGSVVDGGTVVDYAVVMVRLPESATLAARVRAGTATPALLDRVARRVATFHAAGGADDRIARFGGIDVIRANWEENLAQMRPYVGRVLDAATFDAISAYVSASLEGRARLLAARVRDARIRDCHGDLRPRHVYLLDDAADPAGRLAIVDCIEFNERFRYGDVAGEVAFLTMELDEAGRPDLARAFVDAYVRDSGDAALRELLPFYAGYRACVRGKVLAFELDQPEVPAAERQEALRRAGAFFALAAHYAAGPTRPTLALVGGLMGTGKSTLARALCRELGWGLHSSDVTRKRLAGVDPARPESDAFGRGLYGREWTARTYEALLAAAGADLAEGHSVLLDATFARRADRLAAARAASERGAAVVFLECVCPEDVALDRLARRWAARVEAPGGGHTDEASGASDGRPDLYAAQRVAWDPCNGAAEAGMRRVTIPTALPLAIGLERALDALGVPRLFCPLAAPSGRP